jgi:cytochrome P450
MTIAGLREAALFVTSPDGHIDDDRMQAAFALLRAKAPVYWVEPPGVRPFWLVTRYADVMAVERRGAPFAVAPRSFLSSEAGEASMRQVSGKRDVLRGLVQMDDPDHGAYRDIALPWFTSARLSALETWVCNCAQEEVARIAGRTEVFDFATVIAVAFPMRVMMHILGLPASDDQLILKLARGLTGAEDPDRSLSDRPAESIRLAGVGMRDYFNRVTTDRRQCPTEDLSSAIANARVHGMPIPDYERLSYFMQLAIAAQENTACCIAGGLHALLTHPAQWRKLRADPALLDRAIEEMLRWTSPARHLIRTATADTEIGGHRIRAGEAVVIFFNSANRDETVFDAAESFQTDRYPNPHLAFGLGRHFCLGAQLARLELRALFRALLPELWAAEIAGLPRRARSAAITGISFLPISCVWRANPR